MVEKVPAHGIISHLHERQWQEHLAICNGNPGQSPSGRDAFDFVGGTRVECPCTGCPTVVRSNQILYAEHAAPHPRCERVLSDGSDQGQLFPYALQHRAEGDQVGFVAEGLEYKFATKTKYGCLGALHFYVYGRLCTSVMACQMIAHRLECAGATDDDATKAGLQEVLELLEPNSRVPAITPPLVHRKTGKQADRQRAWIRYRRRINISTGAPLEILAATFDEMKNTTRKFISAKQKELKGEYKESAAQDKQAGLRRGGSFRAE